MDTEIFHRNRPFKAKSILELSSRSLQGAIKTRPTRSLFCMNHPSNMTEDNFNFQTFVKYTKNMKVKDSWSKKIIIWDQKLYVVSFFFVFWLWPKIYILKNNPDKITKLYFQVQRQLWCNFVLLTLVLMTFIWALRCKIINIKLCFQ